MSDLEFAHFPNHRKRSCAEPGSSEKRKPSHRTQRWEITCNLSTLPRAPSTVSAVSPGSRPHPPPQKRGTRSTAKDSASLGLADELCKLQKLNRGHTTCPSQQRREEGGLGRIPTLLGRGWGRWRAGAPLAAPRTPSSRSLLELQHPSSRPSSELRWEKGPERRGSWGAVGGPEWSRLHPEGSRSQEENNSRPSVARALRVSRSRLLPQLLQVQRGGGSSPESGIWGSQTPGGPGRWDWERARGTQNAPPAVGGLVIHSHPRSLRTYPCPSRPASDGESAGESPSPNLARPPSLLGPPLFLSSSVSPPALCRHLAAGEEKGLAAGPSQPLRPARPPRLLPSSESQTQRRGPELRTPRPGSLPTPRTHPI